MKRPLSELVRANGVCIQYVWKWLIDGELVTRQVNAAIKRGDLYATYYHNGASVNLTPQGRAVGAESNTNPE